MKYGIFYAYWEKDWDGDYFKYVKKVNELGLDALEIAAPKLAEMSDKEVIKLGKLAKENNVVISCNHGPNEKYDISSKDEATRNLGIAFEKKIMDKMVLLGSNTLIGVMYNHWPYNFKDLDKEGCWKRSVESMKILANYALERNITLNLEVLNRFENILINTVDEGIRYCNDVNVPSVKLLLDTFHLNIEENDIIEAFRKSKGYLGHVHVGERNRRLPCDYKGSLPWREIGKVLNEIGYDRLVIAEPFVTSGGEIAKDIKVWRNLVTNTNQKDLDEDAKNYGKFIREAFSN